MRDHRDAPLAVLAILAVLILASPAAAAGLGEGCPPAPDPAALRSFLEDQYVEAAGLLRASPDAWPDNQTIYVASDNILAAPALEALGSPLAQGVQEALSRYTLTWNNKTDVLVAHPIPGVFRPNKTTLLSRIGPYAVKHDGMDPRAPPLEDWRGYADLLAYHALNALLQGDTGTALRDYGDMLSLWDSRGFRDRAYNESRGYESYKLALAYYVYRALRAAGAEPPGDPGLPQAWKRILACLQDGASGGIHTNYAYGEEGPRSLGGTNVETTSMAVLALYSPYPDIVGSKPGEASDPSVLHASPAPALLILLAVCAAHWLAGRRAQ